LKGQSTYLRELRLSDVNDRYYSWLADPLVNQYLESRFALQSLESIRHFVESRQGKGDEFLFAICRREGDRHIGNIKLGPVDWHHRHAHVGLLIGERDCWGKGHATEAIGLVCEFAFRRLNLNRLQAGAYLPNQGSIKAFERSGFQREGLQKEHFLFDGEYVDAVLLGLTHARYEAERRTHRRVDG